MGYLKSMTPAEELAAFLCIRGNCFMSMGRYDDTLTSYDLATRLVPDSLLLKLASKEAEAEVEYRINPQARNPSESWMIGLDEKLVKQFQDDIRSGWRPRRDSMTPKMPVVGP